MTKQYPRARAHQLKPSGKFDYSLDFKKLNLRQNPELYQVGLGEQGVLLVEPYKSEILPHWKFKNPALARISIKEILKLFEHYKSQEDFVGMDMSRKFIQMGFTRARRYANHKSGRKYDDDLNVRAFETDEVKAASAKLFKKAWDKIEKDVIYRDLKLLWKLAFG